MLPFFLHNQKYLCYTDTDSLVMTRPLHKKFISENMLGFFKKEAENNIEIFGNKHYKSIINNETVQHIKGVGRNFTQSGDFFTFVKMVRTKESIRGDKQAGIFVEVVKHLSKRYTKRKLLKNNKTQILTIKN